MSALRSGLSFGKESRLIDAAAYSQVFDRAKAKASHKHLLLLARENGLQHDRLGLVIAKKHVRRAVQRNRIKRVVREFFRQQEPDRAPADIVVLARSGIDQLDNAALSSILRRQWQKLSNKLPPCRA